MKFRTYLPWAAGVLVAVGAAIGIAAALPPAPPPPPDAPKAAPVPGAKKPTPAQEELKAHDLKKLQGKWAVVRQVYGGTLQTGDRGSWVFKGDTVKTNHVYEGTFTIDTSTRPKRLTHTFTDGEGRRRTMAYIYAFDDDQLLLSGRFPFFDEDQPPTDFNSNNFYRLKRADD
jgi:uncharacterized protein (TIGR03067 family)